MSNTLCVLISKEKNDITYGDIIIDCEVYTMKIGVFDSGIGGASVLKELVKIMPNEEYLYLSDSKNNPYGDRDLDELITICKKNVDYLLENKCEIIVIGCNTASVKTASLLREEYKDVPIFAIEPAYKVVHDFSYDNPTLVMATKGTIESERFNNLYHKYDNNKTFLISCVGLADVIEEGNKEKIKECLEKYLDEYKGKVSNVVLGCTHYAFITDEIREILGNVRFFYGAEALAKHVKSEMEKMNKIGTIENDRDSEKIQFVDTSNSEYKRKRFDEFING